jgi:hypothetical protein
VGLGRLSATVLRVRYQNIGLTCHPTSSWPFCKLSVDVRNIATFRLTLVLGHITTDHFGRGFSEHYPHGADKPLPPPQSECLEVYRTIPTLTLRGRNPSALLWLTPRSYPSTFRCYTVAKNSKWKQAPALQSDDAFRPAGKQQSVIQPGATDNVTRLDEEISDSAAPAFAIVTVCIPIMDQVL